MAGTSKPVIVIVPGAFHRPAHYEKVTKPLREQGYEVLTPALVTTGEKDLNPDFDHTDDHRAIHDVLLPVLDQGKKAVIVSHSYGSLPATTAVEGQTTAERSARGLKGGIEAIVTISGFAYPARGKSVLNDDKEPDPMPYHTLSDGIIHLGDAAKPLFYSDLSEQEADAAWSLLFRKQTWKSIRSFPQYITADISVPKTYVLCENDRAVPPPFQEMMAKTGKYDHVVRVPSGHAPFLTKPEMIIDVLVEVANKI